MIKIIISRDAFWKCLSLTTWNWIQNKKQERVGIKGNTVQRIEN
jgi:hypothetical protein